MQAAVAKLNLQKSERKKKEKRQIWLFKNPKRRTVQVNERTGKENWWGLKGNYFTLSKIWELWVIYIRSRYLIFLKNHPDTQGAVPNTCPSTGS